MRGGGEEIGKERGREREREETKGLEREGKKRACGSHLWDMESKGACALALE